MEAETLSDVGKVFLLLFFYCLSRHWAEWNPILLNGSIFALRFAVFAFVETELHVTRSDAMNRVHNCWCFQCTNISARCRSLLSFEERAKGDKKFSISEQSNKVFPFNSPRKTEKSSQISFISHVARVGERIEVQGKAENCVHVNPHARLSLKLEVKAFCISVEFSELTRDWVTILELKSFQSGGSSSNLI